MTWGDAYAGCVLSWICNLVATPRLWSQRQFSIKDCRVDLKLSQSASSRPAPDSVLYQQPAQRAFAARLNSR